MPAKISPAAEHTITIKDEKNNIEQKVEKAANQVEEAAKAAKQGKKAVTDLANGKLPLLNKQLSRKAKKTKKKLLKNLSLDAVKPTCGESTKLLMSGFTGNSGFFRKKAEEFACRTNNQVMQAQSLLTNVQNILLVVAVNKASANESSRRLAMLKSSMAVCEELWYNALETIIEYAPYLAQSGAPLSEYVETFEQLIEDANGAISGGATDGNVAMKGAELLLTYCNRFVEMQRYMWQMVDKVDGLPNKVFKIIMGAVQIGGILTVLGMSS